MVSGSTKRVVVIRDIPSNIVEEAILILKNDSIDSGKQGKSVKEAVHKSKKLNHDLLIKEAEMIVNNYIKECKAKGLSSIEPITKRGLLKSKLSVNIIINVALAGSIALLIFLLTRFI
ncbi:MAG: hypothetical protein QHH06_11780 [Clostridiales bacterium]|jgi:hypothetical protein|nr:hypothetical protein [Eubacteriales bacterium]MDH7567138.1 hypothetical protein [Clostridiales bacterium]